MGPRVRLRSEVRGGARVSACGGRGGASSPRLPTALRREADGAERDVSPSAPGHGRGQLRGQLTSDEGRHGTNGRYPAARWTGRVRLGPAPPPALTVTFPVRLGPSSAWAALLCLLAPRAPRGIRAAFSSLHPGPLSPLTLKCGKGGLLGSRRSVPKAPSSWGMPAPR